MMIDEHDSKAISMGVFRRANVTRARESFGHRLTSWTPAEWGCALAGEVGELCNLLKKLRRGEQVNRKDLADECADVFAYLDLVAAALDIDLEIAIISKWNEVSQRRGYPVRLK
jgi:NTP pyrophosphatase (non-canonical NTP hydrolase)